MARRLRIQFENAKYHVINRGNYRRDLFETVGAAQAFLAVLDEATSRYRWRLHAFVLMRNHYHLALETPHPNLVEGMHWLQSTIATRFNRFRRENGHLFQGRYKSILVEDDAAFARVVDYIHLNPARARVVTPEHVGAYRWSSLHRAVRSPSTNLITNLWRPGKSCGPDDAGPWQAYEQRLIKLAADERAQELQGLTRLSSGWAIGSTGWRRAIAKEYHHLSLDPGLPREELREIQQAAWAAALNHCLEQSGRKLHEVQTRPRAAAWKLEIARQLRQVGVPAAWIANTLMLGKPSSLRSYLCRSRLASNQQTAA